MKQFTEKDMIDFGIWIYRHCTMRNHQEIAEWYYHTPEGREVFTTSELLEIYLNKDNVKPC